MGILLLISIKQIVHKTKFIILSIFLIYSLKYVFEWVIEYRTTNQRSSRK